MAGDSSEHDAHTRKLHRYISEAIRRVDEGTSRSKSVLDLFVPALEIQRQKLRENCERLIFADPLLYGRKAQELLWRKGYYETVSTAKRLRAGSKNYDDLILSHINSGIGHYHNLISRIQIEMNVNMVELLDYPIVCANALQQNDAENNKKLEFSEWAKVSIQTCLVYLGDLCRYKTEYEECADNSMAVRYYLQAAGIDPRNGMPYNQLGTLYTGKNYYLDSVRYYIVCLSCENPFEGAEDNLLRVLDKNNKYLETSMSKQNDTSDQQESIKQFICKFLAMIECCYFDKNPASFNELCTDALYELNLCLPLRPLRSPEPNMCHEEYMKYLQQQEVNPDYLNCRILHKIVIISLLCINKFENEKLEKALPLKAFVLAVLSQILQKILNDFVDIGFNIQSPEEIVEERREKMKNYKNRNEYLKDGSGINAPKENKMNHHADIENSNQNDVETSKDKSVESIVSEKNTEDQKEDGNDKIIKTKAKKSILQKIRRRKRRLTSENTTDGSESDDSIARMSDTEINKSSINDSDSENDVSEESYFTYTSSDDEIEDAAINEKSNSHTSSENDNVNKDSINDNAAGEKIRDEEKEKNANEPDKKKEFDEDKFNKFLEDDNLIVVSMLLNWLYVEDKFIISCRSTGQVLFQTLVNILNIVNRQIFPRLSRNTYNVDQQYHQSLYKIHEVIMALKYKYKPIPLPEDYDMRSISFLNECMEEIKWDVHKYTNLTPRQINGIRFLRMIDFGVYIVKLKFGIIFNRRLKMYTFKRTKPINKRGVIHTKKYPKELKLPITKLMLNNDQNATSPVTQTEGLQRNMGKLWLSAQVQELESEVRAGKHQRVLPAYVVVDAEALSKHTHLVKQLVSLKRLIVLIPSIVLQLMDEIKKESGGARNATRWLENQLLNGSQFLRTQRTSETATIPSVKYPKKMPRDLHNFAQIIEFCYYFISQEGKNSVNGDSLDGDSSKLVNGSEESGNDAALNEDNESKSSQRDGDNNNIIIFLTGSRQSVETGECNELSRADLVKNAGVAVENIHDFCAKMKNLFIKGGKNR